MAGFEREIFEEPEAVDRFSCPCCLLVINDWTIDSCGHSFCYECIAEWVGVSGKCPISKTYLSLSSLIKHPQLNGELSKSKVRCIHKGKGCAWTGLLEEYSRHLTEECDNESTSCSLGCGQTFIIKAKCQHETECPNVILNCEFCSKSTKRGEMPTHINTCPQRPVGCPACNEILPMGEVEGHLSLCPKVKIACVHAEFGCKWINCRDLKDAHMEENALEHEDLLIKFVLGLKKEKQDLLKEISKMKVEELNNRKFRDKDKNKSFVGKRSGEDKKI